MWSQGWFLISLKLSAVAERRQVWDGSSDMAGKLVSKLNKGWLEAGDHCSPSPRVTFSAHAEPFDHCPARGYAAAWAGARDVYMGGGCCNLHMPLIHPVPLFPQTLSHITVGCITAGAPSAETRDCPSQAQLPFPEISLIATFWKVCLYFVTITLF